MDFTSYPQAPDRFSRSVARAAAGALLSLEAMERARQTEVRVDGLDRPKPSRFSESRPDYDVSMSAHAEAVAADSPGYADPSTGLFVMTAAYLRDRGWCCDRGCRHCPYEDVR